MLYSEEALYALLCKYVLSEADAEERLWVEEWLQTDAQHPELLASIEKVLRHIPYEKDGEATEVAWQRLVAKMEPTIKKRNSWWMAAAIFVLAAGAGLWWMTARNGKVQTFTGPIMAQLKDGTTVQLDSLSELKVFFSSKQRLVKLSGKALFDVTPDASHPFIVQLDQREVRVLGTRFMIDYTHKVLRVHVNSGSVMVDSIVLSTGMLLAHEKVAAHVINADKKELVFTDTPLSEVLQTIGVVYDKQVTADNELLQLPVTATFTGEPVENVLSAIAFMTNTTMTQHGSATELKKHEE